MESHCILPLTKIRCVLISFSLLKIGLPSLYGGDAPHGGNGIGSFGLMG